MAIPRSELVKSLLPGLQEAMSKSPWPYDIWPEYSESMGGNANVQAPALYKAPDGIWRTGKEVVQNAFAKRQEELAIEKLKTLWTKMPWEIKRKEQLVSVIGYPFCWPIDGSAEDRMVATVIGEQSYQKKLRAEQAAMNFLLAKGSEYGSLRWLDEPGWIAEEDSCNYQFKHRLTMAGQFY